ncbi:cation:proton antiporter [Microbacterium sp. NRRL B-14842]|uniref:cation:proton antiporter domain-containing protein n=1 Tax=Microbacterium sp. NRRL B-14842 TaxID=3162881 RepID=UPI003D2CA50D
MPIVVFELVLGILVGPAVLGWVEPGPLLEKLSDFGLAVLFFVAGSEIDFRQVAGSPWPGVAGLAAQRAAGHRARILLRPGRGHGSSSGSR